MNLEFLPAIILILNSIFAVTIVFFERRNPTAALAWLVVLFSLPSIGFVLYLIFGQNYTRQRMFVIKEQEDRRFLRETFEEQYREFTDRRYRFATPEAEEFRETIVLLLRNNRAFLTEENRIDLYTRGEDGGHATTSTSSTSSSTTTTSGGPSSALSLRRRARVSRSASSSTRWGQGPGAGRGRRSRN